MRAVINFKLNSPLILPIQYNHIIHGAILNWIENEEYQKFIHDQGFKVENRKYKLYTFSKLQGRFTMDSKNKKIIYHSGVNLLISSYDERLLSCIVNSLIIKHKIRILDYDVEIDNIETYCRNVDSNEIKVYTKSPITVYSTFQVNDKNKTYYYSPYEEEFGQLIQRNLINKYVAFHGKEPDDKNFSIELLDRRKPKESAIIYKNILIKGWSGEFLLKGSKELLNIAYQAGVGSKNSQGFGCIECIK